MTDAEYEKQRARVKEIADRWIKPIGLGWWHIDVEYHRDLLDTTEENRANNWSPTFRVPVKWEYANAIIHCSLPMVEGLDDYDLELSFVHELMHIFINEMREPDPDGKHEERVATTLAKGFIWIRDHVKEETTKEMAKSSSKSMKHEKAEPVAKEKMEENLYKQVQQKKSQSPPKKGKY